MQISSWQQELQQTIRDPFTLLEKVAVPVNAVSLSEKSLQRFPVRVPESFVARMEKGNPNDPLLLQVLPRTNEDQENAAYSSDPVGDLHAQVSPGVLHKYYGRVLLVTTGACAIHCRYCFRQHFPYTQENPSQHHWQYALEYIDNDASINEVILSGGDPLSLSDDKLNNLIERLEYIPHLKRLRIHTRMPVIIPERVVDAHLQMLNHSRLKVLMVIHVNHPNEIDSPVLDALRNYRQAGIPVMNQSVLLQEINDCAETLMELNEYLFDAGVLPYYLHLLDPVTGASHFDVRSKQALAIMQELREKLPGYLVPKLVREVAGKPYKLPIL